MSDISSQLIKDSYNYVLQSDLSTGIVYRIGGGIPVNPKFLSGLTINSNFNYSNGTEQPGFVLITDASGNASWGPVSGSSSGNYLSLSGGTVTGETIFTSGVTANTISATTYQNLPPTPFLPLSGGTVTGDTNFTAGLTGTSIVVNSFNYTWAGPVVGSIFSYFNDTIYVNETGKTHYFGGGPGNVQNNLSVPNGTLYGSSIIGGGVTGETIFTSGLTATTISATTYLNLPSGLTCNDLSGCTIIQNIEQDIINIQDNYVPYTGATKDVNLSGYSINANSLNFYVDQNNNGSFGGVVSGPSFRKLTFKTLDSGGGFGLVDINVNPEEGINFSIGDSSETSESKIYLNPETTEIKTSTSSYVHTLFFQNGDASLAVDDLGNVESNNIGVLGSKTYSRKYIEAPGFEGDYANLNTLTSTTISATTYFNLPVSGVTGGTGISATTSNGLVTIVNTAPDQIVTITGGTNIGINGTYPNFGINFTGSTGASGDFLSLSGGTVTGATIFTGGLTANTISATTITSPSISPYGLIVATSIGYQNIF